MRSLLIVDVADDPTYRTLEPQLLDSRGGVGLVLLAYRHDAFTTPNGRQVDLRIHVRLRGGRDRMSVLAPVGGTFATPESFPFLWLPGMSFVPDAAPRYSCGWTDWTAPSAASPCPSVAAGA